MTSHHTSSISVYLPNLSPSKFWGVYAGITSVNSSTPPSQLLNSNADVNPSSTPTHIHSPFLFPLPPQPTTPHYYYIREIDLGYVFFLTQLLVFIDWKDFSRFYAHPKLRIWLGAHYLVGRDRDFKTIIHSMFHVPG